MVEGLVQFSGVKPIYIFEVIVLACILRSNHSTIRIFIM